MQLSFCSLALSAVLCTILLWLSDLCKTVPSVPSPLPCTLCSHSHLGKVGGKCYETRIVMFAPTPLTHCTVIDECRKCRAVASQNPCFLRHEPMELQHLRQNLLKIGTQKISNHMPFAVFSHCLCLPERVSRSTVFDLLECGSLGGSSIWLTALVQ